MYNARQVFSKHLTELALYFALDKVLDDGDGVEGAVDVNGLEGVGFEDEGNAFLFGDY